MRFPALLLTLAFLALPLAGAASEAPQPGTALGTIGAAVPDQLDVFTVKVPPAEGAPAQRGDVVQIVRGEKTLGEAFVVPAAGNGALRVSLKGTFQVLPGDAVVFLRRPAPVQAVATPPASANRPSRTTPAPGMDLRPARLRVGKVDKYVADTGYVRCLVEVVNDGDLPSDPATLVCTWKDFHEHTVAVDSSPIRSLPGGSSTIVEFFSMQAGKQSGPGNVIGGVADMVKVSNTEHLRPVLEIR